MRQSVSVRDEIDTGMDLDINIDTITAAEDDMILEPITIPIEEETELKQVEQQVLEQETIQPVPVELTALAKRRAKRLKVILDDVAELCVIICIYTALTISRTVKTTNRPHIVYLLCCVIQN